ncbi:cystathionine beta-lyase [Scopulibacillus darangshiensis]|uniref:cysteine-S-conjugate beta-lyase n=1 Tax=Scopulibacillus darangshiensis TaxID=442528 RepID=A0A4R2P182_9BACL|nr:MalY/PatB family protein [Scopulibacillus darangshiensis]TCP27818.1 cystathionine beta-lyase [Scopulibacillus darangshiensis]
MKAYFDEAVNRFHTNSAKWDGMALEYGQDVIPLSVADMDLRAPQNLIDKLANMACHGVYGYTELYQPYYDAVQHWFGRKYNWPIETEWIVFCPRIVQAVSLIIQNFTDKGDNVLTFTPSYMPITNAVTVNHRTLVESPLIYKNYHYEIDFEDIEEKMKEGVKLLLLCSPHNPTGRVWTREELMRLGELCVRYNVLIVSDDIHADFIHEGHHHTFIAELSHQIADQTIICTSPAKTFNLASLEIANIIIPNQRYRQHFKETLIQAGIHNPTFFAVPALEAAYTACDEWLENVRDYIGGNIAFAMSFFKEQLPGLNIIEPEGTYLLWIDCRNWSFNESDLKHFILEEAKVNVSFGSSFGKAYEGFIRVNVATSRVLLKEGLRRIAHVYHVDKIK